MNDVRNIEYISPPSPPGCALPESDIDNASVLVHRVGIETGRSCNLRCTYCFADSGAALSNELRKEELFSVIDQAAEVGASIIPIVGGGEPTMNPDILEIVSYIAAKGLTPGIFTNCILMTKQLAQQLFDLGAYVVGKLNSFDHVREDTITGVKGASVKIKRGLEILQEAGFSSTNPSRMALNTLILNSNYSEIPRIFRWMRDNNVYPYIQMPVLTGRTKAKLTVSDEEAKDLFYRLLEIDQQEYGYSWIPIPPNVSWPCTQRTTSCYITSLGDVQLCNSTNVSHGNIRQQSLRDILLSPDMQAVRDLSLIHGKCSTCSHLTGACRAGCTANTFNACSDVFASDERCWHM